MLSFFQQLVVDVHTAGLKISIESASMFAGYYSSDSGMNISDYYGTLTVQQYEQQRAVMIATIYNEVKPDYIDVGSEPDTEAENSGFDILDTPNGWATAVTTYVSMLPSPHTIPIGTGVGNWKTSNGTDFIANEVAIPGVDYIDLHCYPVATENGVSTISYLVTLIDAAQTAGKPVAMSEWWLLKVSGSSGAGNADDPTTDSLDAYSFWAPLDQEFLTDMYRVANWKQFMYGSAFWSGYFWGYVTYSANGPAPGAALQVAGEAAYSAALQKGQKDATGLDVQSLVTNNITVPVVANAANYTTSVAVGSLAAIFGTDMASGTASAKGSLGTSLGGVTVTIQDSAGTTDLADLLFVSPGQINFAVPPGLATGVATLTLTGPTTQTTEVSLLTTAPGIFTENGTGAGVAAAESLTIVNGVQTYEKIYTCSGGTCSATPISLANGQVYLILYGTGISGAGQSAVSVTIGGQTYPIEFAGALSEFVGLDQVNVLLPSSLAGSGTVPVQVIVSGVASNSAMIDIQ
jgi:uncharacterized protein (TIGR03437 family)